MERIKTEHGGSSKPKAESDYSVDAKRTPEELVIEYCKQFGDFEEDQLRQRLSGEFEFTQKLPNGKTGGIYLFDKTGKLKDVSALHEVKPIPTKFGKIRPPESRANKLDA